jgi:hypothetical protein
VIEPDNVCLLTGSVADPGFGAFLTFGAGIRNRFFLDPRSQTHIFESLMTIFWVFVNWPNFFLHQFKINKIFNFVIFVATK